jgi:zona occludens toxin
MIAYFLGIPGSGKTYYAVNVIYNNFSNNQDVKKDLKKDYKNCYTNINEFKYELVDHVFYFDYDKFFKDIRTLFNMYKKKCSDDELIAEAKKFNIYKTLFIIDECHNYFDTAKPELIWWLTYHRHLYHDIFLITQNLQLVNSKYKPLAEAFYKAKSQSLTLDKRFFQYMYHTESRMTKASYVNTIKVKRNKKVFELYKSGDTVKSKNVVLRFIIIALLLFLLLFISGYFLYQYLVPSVSKKEITSHVSKIVVSNDVSNDIDVSSMIYMSFLCTDEMCSYKDMYFDIKILAFARENFNLQIINTRRTFSQSLVSVAVDSSFLNFIQGGSNAVSSLDSIDIFNSGK